MTWKNIIKAPVPFDTTSNRDENFRQKIIEYEEKVITPSLTALIQGLAAGQRHPEMTIGFARGSEDKPAQFNIPKFEIGESNLMKLGNNKNFILRVIEEEYKKEGYNTLIGQETLVIRFP
jgi:hypothetical protein